MKQIIVREYLESLTENEELDYLFPILLEAMDFDILTTPKLFKGFSQYGKDIVAVGVDEDKVKKRFYFELKGGNDRHITASNYSKDDGIRQSIIEAMDHEFKCTYPGFNDLPKKIVLVHNGELKTGVRDTFEDFIKKQFPKNGEDQFDRWDIFKLTKLFAKKLYGEYLLTDEVSLKLFKRVLYGIEATNTSLKDYDHLLTNMFEKLNDIEFSGKPPRRMVLIFETIKLISYIVYTTSKELDNLEIAKKHITHLVLKYWHWILKNKHETNEKITKYFYQILIFYFDEVLCKYFAKTIPVVALKDGLSFDKGGRYEEIGYTYRTMEYLQYFVVKLLYDMALKENFEKEEMRRGLIMIINENSVSSRCLLDIHSLTIVAVINMFILLGDFDSAKNYLIKTFEDIFVGKEKSNRWPDANNNIKSVIKYTITGKKPIYYSDSTSLLLSTLFEFLVLFDLKEEYYVYRKWFLENEIDLGVFIPFHRNEYCSLLTQDKENDLEEQLFSRSFRDGYQTNLTLNEDFEEFKNKVKKKSKEFKYEYRTDKAGLGFLRYLAHVYFKTPFFPDEWRLFGEIEKVKEFN